MRPHAVQGDAARLDPFVRLAPRADTRLADVLIEPHRRIQPVEEAADLPCEALGIRIEQIAGVIGELDDAGVRQGPPAPLRPIICRFGLGLENQALLVDRGDAIHGRGPHEHQAADKLRPRRCEVQGDGCAEAHTHEVDLAQPEIRRQVRDGTRGIRVAETWRRVRLTESRQVGGVSGAVGGDLGQKSGEAPARPLARMQAHERNLLVEPAGRRERGTHMKLAEFAVEIGAARAYRELGYGR